MHSNVFTEISLSLPLRVTLLLTTLMRLSIAPVSALATRLISAPSSVAPLSCVSVVDVIVRRRWVWELDLAALSRFRTAQGETGTRQRPMDPTQIIHSVNFFCWLRIVNKRATSNKPFISDNFYSYSRGQCLFGGHGHAGGVGAD